MVLAEGDLGHRVGQTKFARDAVLPVVLLLFLLSKIFTEAVDLALWVTHDGHSGIGCDLARVSVEHRHHDSG